jgi:hypothetical protein
MCSGLWALNWSIRSIKISHTRSYSNNIKKGILNPYTMSGDPTGPTTLIFAFSYLNTYRLRIDLFSNRYSPNNARRPSEVSLIPLTGVGSYGPRSIFCVICDFFLVQSALRCLGGLSFKRFVLICTFYSII